MLMLLSTVPVKDTNASPHNIRSAFVGSLVDRCGLAPLCRVLLNTS